MTAGLTRDCGRVVTFLNLYAASIFKNIFLVKCFGLFWQKQEARPGCLFVDLLKIRLLRVLFAKKCSEITTNKYSIILR